MRLSICRDVTTLNICDGTHGAIAVALVVILIVKAKDNRVSYGNMDAFVYDRTSTASGLASFCTGIWVLFG